MVYGFNPLTGRTTDRWRVRNVVRWCRPNPAPGELADKFRPATSEMLVACTGRTRYFDLDAVRTVAIDQRTRTTNGSKKGDPAEVQTANYDNRVPSNPAGAPPLDWWEIPTEGYPGAHFATWPKALLIRPIEAMCPRRVCLECGRPSERITEDTPEYAANRSHSDIYHQFPNKAPEALSRTTGRNGGSRPAAIVSAERITTGWTDCGHSAWRNGLVLDPFAGSGTTLAVAHGHGRSAIGIDLDVRNVELARQRVGPMFFEVVEAVAVPGN